MPKFRHSKGKIMTNYILFDTETTGTKPEDRIIQIGAMIFANKEIEVYDELCSCDEPIKIEAMEIHNIVEDDLLAKPSFQASKFYTRLNELNKKENFLIAHNIKFDLAMIEKEDFTSNYSLIDTLKCSRHLFPELPFHRLQYLRYALELYKDEKEEAKKHNLVIKAHDAIGDVLVMKLFLSKLVARAKNLYPKDNPMLKLCELSTLSLDIKVFTFGKYKGKEIAIVAKEDLSYLKWLRSTSKDEDICYNLDKYI